MPAYEIFHYSTEVPPWTLSLYTVCFTEVILEKTSTDFPDTHTPRRTG